MSMVLGHQSSYTSRSISSSSGMSLSGSRRFIGAGTSRISTGSIRVRPPSVYGGADGTGTRISQSIFTGGTMASYTDTAVITNEKMTMQNLNDRLASYLEKVRTLEAANRKLELQIREYYEKKGPTATRDYTIFFATISDLRNKIMARYSDNQRFILQVDNAVLAGDDFRIKYETEMNLRTMVESDVARLRGVRDSMTLAISDLEVQIEGLKEELAYMKTNHEEEMRLLRVQQTGQVNVEVDSVQAVDLAKVLAEMREQYETLMEKNRLEQERWCKSKLETLKADISQRTVEVTTQNTELSELKRTYQGFEITLQGLHKEISCLQQNLVEVKNRYALQLNQLQLCINRLEEELQCLKVSIEQQQTDYKLLLDIKMRLELEIAEYRRLLEGEYREEKKVVISKVVEEHKPHIERRVKTIVEEIIDGKVVSREVDTQMEEIQ